MKRPSLIRLAALLPLIALVLLGAMFAGRSLWRDSQVQTAAMVGKPVPALVLPDLRGGPPAPVAGDGPYLVNFFASWCPPCVVEHPVLMALEEQGVTIVGVAYKDEPAKSQAFLDQRGDPFARVLIDRDARAGMEFGVTGPPETYLVSSDGVILAKHVGPLDEASARRMLARLR